MEKKRNRRPRSRGIAETYIHILEVPRELSKEKVRNYMERHVHAWAEDRFKNFVVVKIRTEEGSLKVWVLVGGLAIFQFVANYGSFRTGIDHLVSDARAFSEFVINRFAADKHIPEDILYRTERRLGVPGKIQRFLKSFDNLNSPGVSQQRRHEETERLRKEFLEIIELLDNEQDRDLFMEEVPPNISQQPNRPLPDPIRGVISLEAIRNEEDWGA